MVCCFTGHRNIPPTHMLKLPELLDNELERLILSGVEIFRGGGAVGFDTIAELKALEKRKKYPHIRLELILPCKDQVKKWNERDRAIYEYILKEADVVSYVEEKYTPYCMHARNRRLVNESDFCLAYLSEQGGGTAYTVNYAKKKNVDVINLFDRLSKDD